MISNLPPPPVPADLDLSSLGYMPLLVRRLKRSRAWMMAKREPDLGFYMLNLWLAAWEECPCASLPDDDLELCDKAMCDPKRWDMVRAAALHGFQKHSDGRLYHGVIVEQALIALEKRAKWRTKKKKQREGQASLFGDDRVPGDSEGTTADVPPASPETTEGQVGDEPLRDGTGRDGNNPEDKSSGCERASAPPSKFAILMTKDWPLPAIYREWAIEARPKLNPDIVVIGFRAHYDGKRKRDWEPLWRKWVIAEIERSHNVVRPVLDAEPADPEKLKRDQARYVQRKVPGVPVAWVVALVRDGSVTLEQGANYVRERPDVFADRHGLECTQAVRDQYRPIDATFIETAKAEMAGSVKHVSRENAEDLQPVPDEPAEAGAAVLRDLPCGVHAGLAQEAAGGDQAPVEDAEDASAADRGDGGADGVDHGDPRPAVADRGEDAELLDIPAFLDARRRTAA